MMRQLRSESMKGFWSKGAALLVLILSLTGCGYFPNPAEKAAQPTSAQTISRIASPTDGPHEAVLLPSQTAAPLPTTTPTDRPTKPPRPTASSTPTSTTTATPTPIPTYTVLRGKVIAAQVVCHYGPGAPYLYKYALIGGSNLEIIGRVELGEYLEVRAIGGNNPCWVNPKWMEVKGDLKDVAPIPADQVKLPRSPYYGPLAGVSATRTGNEVTIFWQALVLKAGDDSEQVPYLVEAWVCQDGQFKFLPVGSWQTAAKIIDEPGCAETSHGRVYGAEKHGYTKAVEIPWPTPQP